MLKGINWVAVLVAVVLLEILGYLWYGPLMGKSWTEAYQASMGHAPDMSRVAVNQSLGVVNTLILTVGLAWVIRRWNLSGGRAVALAVALWLVFDFTTMSLDYLYMGLGGRLVLINMAYQLIAYAVAGAVLALMPGRATVSKSELGT